MRLKITLSLLAILLGLLAYIFYVDPKAEDPALASERRSILGDMAVGLDYLSVYNARSGTQTTLELKDQRWRLVEPYQWPANEFAVERILNQLRFLERITSFDAASLESAGAALADYGLEPPELTLFFGKGGQLRSLGIGKATEVGNHLYILAVDKLTIHVVDRSLLDSLSVDLDTLRDARVFETALFETRSWNIQAREDSGSLRYRFSRAGERWTFETPIRSRADTAAVNSVLSRALELEARTIVAPRPGDLTPYGLQAPSYRIAVESGTQREVLEIGNPVDGDPVLRFAKREDRAPVFQVRIDFLDLLANAQTKLRERRIFEGDLTSATTVTIQRRDSPPLTLQKLENGAWELVLRDAGQGIQTLPGDAQSIEEMLEWLDNLKAVPDSGFVNDAPSAPDLESYGLEVPEFSIAITSTSLHDAPGQPVAKTETLLIGDPAPQDRSERFVRVADRDFVYSVYGDIFERIRPNPLLYKDRRIALLPAGAVLDRLIVQRLADSETLASFDAAAGLDAASARLSDTLANLAARSYTRNGFAPSIEVAGRVKPWTYKVVGTFHRASSNASETFELYVSETTGGPVLLGGSPALDLTFRFGQDFIDAFDAIVFDRQTRPMPEEPFSDRALPTPPVESAEAPPTDADEEPAADEAESETPDPPPAPAPDSEP